MATTAEILAIGMGYSTDEDGNSMWTTEEFLDLLDHLNGEYTFCSCGSQYCNHCKGSYDASFDVRFPDGSVCTIDNPRQSAFPRQISMAQ